MPTYRVTLTDEQRNPDGTYTLTFKEEDRVVEHENVVFEAPDEFEANLAIEQDQIKDPPSPISIEQLPKD